MFARRKKIQHLETRVAELQHTIDILASETVRGRKSAGNPYPDYASKTRELDAKYSGTADWGGHIAHNLVELRAAFIIGSGIKPVIKPGVSEADGERALAYIQQFISRNNLDEEVPQDWAKEAEIEGKFLCRLWPNPQAKQVEARFLPWTATRYTVDNEPGDYASFTGVRYTTKDGQERSLNPSEFVYKRFYGRTQRVNETPSKVAKVLAEIEALDKALKDWREINHLFASPTPHFKASDAKQAQELYDKLKGIAWKIGKMLVTTAEFDMVSPAHEGVESLKEEIVANAKQISGATGVPVHFLGLPDLLSNRATAENLTELIGSSTEKERHIWLGFYEELFTKVMTIANERFQAGVKADAIGCEIPLNTASKLRELAEVWLPLFEQRAISHETLLSHVPGVDADEELSRLNDADAQRGNTMLRLIQGEENAA